MDVSITTGALLASNFSDWLYLAFAVFCNILVALHFALPWLAGDRWKSMKNSSVAALGVAIIATIWLACTQPIRWMQ